MEDANRALLELTDLTDKTNEAERLMAKLLAHVQTFEANQTSVFADRRGSSRSRPTLRAAWRAWTADSPPLSRTPGRA